jgi:large subunit ribosomal protein L23
MAILGKKAAKAEVAPVKKKPAAPKKAEVKKTPVLTKYLTLGPRVSEKGYSLSEQDNTYVFNVVRNANKFDIAQAVSAQFEVGVLKVRIAGVPGKAVRSYRQRGRRSINAKRSDVRKAYVTLKPGDKLPIYAALDQPETPKETK